MAGSFTRNSLMSSGAAMLPEDACDQHRHHGAMGPMPRRSALGYADGNGGGDGFFPAGRGHGRVQPKQRQSRRMLPMEDAEPTTHPTRMGQPVLLQDPDFPVDGHRQAGGGGGRETC